VQSLYKDAISALKAEGKIVELRKRKAQAPLYVHRDRDHWTSCGWRVAVDRDRRPPIVAAALPKRHPSRLKMFRPYYLALKAEQGGISTVKIHDILKKLGCLQGTSFMHSCCHEAKRGTA